MKEFFKKYKKVIIIVLIVLFLIGSGTAVYFLFFYQKLETSSTNESNAIQQQENGITQVPEFELSSSSEALSVMYSASLKWAGDSKVSEFSAVPISISYYDVSYEYIAFEDGKFANWSCIFYSPSKDQTRMYEYDEGVLDDSIGAVDTGEYGSLFYGSVDYPSDVSSIVDSQDIYNDAVDQGLDDESNYVNMYLRDISGYGFVWEIEERSRTEKDEYDIGVIVNTYIYDIYTGELEDIVQEEVY